MDEDRIMRDSKVMEVRQSREGKRLEKVKMLYEVNQISMKEREIEEEVEEKIKKYRKSDAQGK